MMNWKNQIPNTPPIFDEVTRKSGYNIGRMAVFSVDAPSLIQWATSRYVMASFVANIVLKLTSILIIDTIQ